MEESLSCIKKRSDVFLWREGLLGKEISCHQKRNYHQLFCEDRAIRSSIIRVLLGKQVFFLVFHGDKILLGRKEIFQVWEDLLKRTPTTLSLTRIPYDMAPMDRFSKKKKRFLLLCWESRGFYPSILTLELATSSLYIHTIYKKNVILKFNTA